MEKIKEKEIDLLKIWKTSYHLAELIIFWLLYNQINNFKKEDLEKNIKYYAIKISNIIEDYNNAEKFGKNPYIFPEKRKNNKYYTFKR